MSSSIPRSPAKPPGAQAVDRFAASFEACVVRFRPIMRTTMAAFLGTLPIALGLGVEARRRPDALRRFGVLVI
ncbi:MAG: efflux RND transporter permease subunit [Acidobacteriota bacterium]